MKTVSNGRSEAAEVAAVLQAGAPISVFWLGVVAALFYCASLLVAMGAEPVRSDAAAQDVPAVAAASQPHPNTSWFYRHFHKPTWQELLAQCSTPKDVCRAAERFVRYKTEERDRWAPPEETWNTGRGDCEDFAAFVQRLCRELGLETTVQLYFESGSAGEGHAVAVGYWKGQMWVSSIGSYEEVDSEQDIRRKVARTLGCDPDEMWTSKLASTDVDRMINRGLSRPVAAE